LENGNIESFHDKLRDECLNRELFGNLREARVIPESWRIEYNERRPHSALGYRTPSEYAGSRTNRLMGAAAPLAAGGVRGELRNKRHAVANKRKRQTNEPAELQL
jgi:putative transposase